MKVLSGLKEVSDLISFDIFIQNIINERRLHNITNITNIYISNYAFNPKYTYQINVFKKYSNDIQIINSFGYITKNEKLIIINDNKDSKKLLKHTLKLRKKCLIKLFHFILYELNKDISLDELVEYSEIDNFYKTPDEIIELLLLNNIIETNDVYMLEPIIEKQDWRPTLLDIFLLSCDLKNLTICIDYPSLTNGPDDLYRMYYATTLYNQLKRWGVGNVIFVLKKKDNHYIDTSYNMMFEQHLTEQGIKDKEREVLYSSY